MLVWNQRVFRQFENPLCEVIKKGGRRVRKGSSLFMDTLRISSDFLKKVVGNYISKMFKKNGYGSEFELNALEITEMGDGTYKAHLSGDVQIQKEDIIKFLHM